MLRRFLLGALVMSLASFAVAGVPDLNASTASIDASAIGASIYVVPNATGADFSAASAPGGATVDATITLTLVDTGGDPIFAYPLEDLWLETSGGSLVYCEGGTNADAATDIDGQTTFSDPLAAGGSTFGETTRVMVAGAALAGAGLNLIFNSTDMNGDLLVNLTDVASFIPLLGSTTYAGDYNYDGIVNLTDVAKLIQANGASCN
jgi:hypothetical protein